MIKYYLKFEIRTSKKLLNWLINFIVVKDQLFNKTKQAESANLKNSDKKSNLIKKL